MIGRDEYEYLWQDDKTNKLPTELSVPEYTDNLVSWYQSYFFDNETASRQRPASRFSKSTFRIFKTILKPII